MTIPNINDLPLGTKVVISSPLDMFFREHGVIDCSILPEHAKYRRYHVLSPRMAFKSIGHYLPFELTPYRLAAVTDKAPSTLHFIP